MKAIYRIDRVDYVVYNNPNDAVVIYEKFYMKKYLFGIPIYLKKFRQDTKLQKDKSITKTGF